MNTNDPLFKKASEFLSSFPAAGRTALKRHLGCSDHKARVILEKIKSGLPVVAGSDESLTDTGSAEEREIVSRGSTIKTLEDLIRHAEIDLDKWKVKQWVSNKWEVGAKNDVGEIVVSPLWQVKAWLEPREVERTIEAIQSKFIDEVRSVAPKIKKPKQSTGSMLEISIFDLHLGQTSWAAETGAGWGMEQAEKLFFDAATSLLEKASKHEKIERVLFPIGNDFFNVDNLNKTTTSGTPQDEAVRWQESFARGKALVAKTIERIAEVAPVDCIVVSGNHDTQRAFYLGEVMDAYFKDTRHVFVDNTPTARKYKRFGKNLLGFTHGNREKPNELGLIMAAEASSNWSETSFREWHIGHWHHQRSAEFKTGHETQSVRVRVIPSLAGRDAWHAACGYMAQRAAEAFVWRREGGCSANISYYPD